MYGATYVLWIPTIVCVSQVRDDVQGQPSRRVTCTNLVIRPELVNRTHGGIFLIRFSRTFIIPHILHHAPSFSNLDSLCAGRL
jgi:hypothetical protein